MKTNKTVFAVAIFATVALSAGAQQARPAAATPNFEFKTIKANPITSVKNQASSGTCWSFSAVSFIESEIIRINNIKDEAKYPDLSEFFNVSHSYSDKGEKYIRLDGALGFGQGSECDDVLDIIRAYGIVPQAEFTGLNYGTPLPAMNELDAVLKAYLDAVVKVPNRTLTTAWKRGYDAILREYFGAYPQKFTVDGKEYTPESYRDALKVNPDDYVTLTSFTHHPFYSSFAIEVSDNWRGNQAYNVPIDEFMSILKDAIKNGYTAAWGADVSVSGWGRDGLALLLDTQAATAPGSDQERWTGSNGQQKPALQLFVEKTPTQESRQIEFDNKTMTDDHGMHIYGIAEDQNGNLFFMVKNSWGETGRYNGLWYVSEAFVKGQSLDITIHKDALPKELRKKLGK